LLAIQKTAREEELTDLRERLGKLTGREREVAKLLSEGMRNKEIARSLGIEETTVKMHRANLQAKLGVKSTAELTRIFITKTKTRLDPFCAALTAAESPAAPLPTTMTS